MPRNLRNTRRDGKPGRPERKAVNKPEERTREELAARLQHLPPDVAFDVLTRAQLEGIIPFWKWLLLMFVWNQRMFHATLVNHTFENPYSEFVLLSPSWLELESNDPDTAKHLLDPLTRQLVYIAYRVVEKYLEQVRAIGGQPTKSSTRS